MKINKIGNQFCDVTLLNNPNGHVGVSFASDSAEFLISHTYNKAYNIQFKNIDISTDNYNRIHMKITIENHS